MIWYLAGFGIWTVACLAIGWGVGRSSKWEEVNNFPPKTFSLVSEPELIDNRVQLKNLDEEVG